MFGYVDATPAGIYNSDDELWHHMYKRAAEDEDEEKKEGFIDKMKTGVKEAPTKIKDEINKDAKFLSEKTHIPTW